jgi:phage shock protein C
MEKRLYKSEEDKMLAGVFAEYFELDSTWVRIGYAVMFFFGGTGLLLYIICALVMPNKPREY